MEPRGRVLGRGKVIEDMVCLLGEGRGMVGGLDERRGRLRVVVEMRGEGIADGRGEVRERGKWERGEI